VAATEGSYHWLNKSYQQFYFLSFGGRERQCGVPLEKEHEICYDKGVVDLEKSFPQKVIHILPHG
jgi:hypothetical protein